MSSSLESETVSVPEPETAPPPPSVPEPETAPPPVPVPEPEVAAPPSPVPPPEPVAPSVPEPKPETVPPPPLVPEPEVATPTEPPVATPTESPAEPPKEPPAESPTESPAEPPTESPKEEKSNPPTKDEPESTKEETIESGNDDKDKTVTSNDDSAAVSDNKVKEEEAVEDTVTTTEAKPVEAAESEAPAKEEAPAVVNDENKEEVVEKTTLVEEKDTPTKASKEENDIIEEDDKNQGDGNQDDSTNQEEPGDGLQDVDTTSSSAPARSSSYPVSFAPVDNTKRSHSHQKLRSYESRRRTAYGSKLSSSSLYWRSFRELVQKSLLETKQAERIVLSRVLASETYAKHMEAIHKDLLDDLGRTVTDPKKIRKTMTKRAKEKQARDTSVGNIKDDKGFQLGDVGDKDAPMLKSLIESHATLANRYNEATTAVKEQVTGELTNLREQLEDKITTMEVLGDAILEELEAAEFEVTEAWELYYNVSRKIVESQEDTTTQRAGASFQDTELNPQRNCSDTWVHEMHYRMAVAYLSSCWEKCSAELSRLFTSLKATEVSRRHRLRQLLIIFLEKEDTLWMGLPATIAPVLKGIVDRPPDRNVIEDRVQNSIKIRAQAIQREEQLERPKQPTGPGLSVALAKEGNFELSSPLLSDHMCTAKVLEKKDAGMMRSWKTVLAVVTADSFLQLFDVPSNLRLTTGSAVEVAFHALVPPVEIPTVNNIKTGFAPKAWNQFLVPLDSLVLPNCKVVFEDDGQNTAFELHETVFKQGAKLLFGKMGSKKMFFRTRTYDEAQEWIGALQAPK